MADYQYKPDDGLSATLENMLCKNCAVSEDEKDCSSCEMWYNLYGCLKGGK